MTLQARYDLEIATPEPGGEIDELPAEHPRRAPPRIGSDSQLEWFRPASAASRVRPGELTRRTPEPVRPVSG